MADSFSTINLDEERPWANHRSILLGLPITFLTIAWICIVNRLYIRYFVVKSPGWDDFFVILYAIMTTAGTVSIATSVSHGFGEHFITLGIDGMNTFSIDFYIASASYASATAFIKLALLFQYLRVFERGTKMYKLCIGTAVVTALWGIAFSILAWMPCHPVRDYWDVLSPNQCFGFGSKIPDAVMATYAAHTATNMVLDIIIIGIPCVLFFSPGSDRAQKTRLLVLLVMGSWIVVFAAWRLVTIVRNKAATWPVVDPTWYAPQSVLLAILEIDCAAICASLPIFWPQISKHWGEIVVVKEVKVTRETRTFDEDESALTRNYLGRMGSEGSMDDVGGGKVKDLEGGGTGMHGRTKSRSSSKGNGTQFGGEAYVLDNVNPFGNSMGRDNKQLAEATSKPGSRGFMDGGRW
ncbi:uncharacterized protein B0I36DRAFT_250640 [Microdochium trichocladiopsis]|uniref:Rhodopsin domain-containing protein n=1 Tax=Microdochium trichocladiopsis TaxID=1682393 RepID=A0A9P8XYG4_9PEZI|nr:uncharacterized protein B0I36DRAFT_250640 [Microdochium trichocladiopsis]KAH7025128.1 hypothetical protein B0I36DRAFT_250640 [Microdochium trichocladiopsis]